MLRDELNGIVSDEACHPHEAQRNEWHEIDLALRRIAKERAALDAEEARWLREAARVKIWRDVGCGSLLAYLELRCGYTPRTGRDRMRVAFALEELPGLTAALASGEQPFSSVRELVRVVTPEVEDEWLETCRNKTCFEVQRLVAGRRKGGRPSDAPLPELETRPLELQDIKPSTLAAFREARLKAQADRGESLDDDALLALLCGAFLQGSPRAEDAAPRAKYQVAVVVCERCKQGWQDGAGAKFAMSPSEVARAECDAQRIGRLDAEVPTRATQDISPRVRRQVWRRDGGTCTLPSCRAAANLELHHIIPRSDGGSHTARNVLILCDAHHSAAHRGVITISGRAPDQLVITKAQAAHVGHSKLDHSVMLVEARTALVGLGFKRPEAAAAIDAASQSVGPTVTLETIIREALRRCPKPRQP
jgi:hypothetical protein